MTGSLIGEVKQGHIYRTRLDKLEAPNQQLGHHGLRLARETELARKATSDLEQKITEILSEKVGLERRILDLERQMIQKREAAEDVRQNLEQTSKSLGKSSRRPRRSSNPTERSTSFRSAPPRSQDGQLSLSRHGRRECHYRPGDPGRDSDPTRYWRGEDELSPTPGVSAKPLPLRTW